MPPEQPPEDGGLFGLEFPEISWAGFWNEFFTGGAQFNWANLIEPHLAPIISKVMTTLTATTIETVARSGETIGRSVDEWEEKAGPIILEAVAKGLSDYFGVPITPGDLGIRGGTSTRKRTADRIGSSVLKRLMGELGEQGPVSATSGEASAERALGFTIQTAIEGWITGVVSSGPLSKWLPNWADLDDVMVEALGLGSISSRATGPVLDALINTPFTWRVNETYRPSRFTEIEAVRSWIRGDISEDQYFTRMGELGWTREDAATQKKLKGRFPFKEDMARMLRLGMIDEDRTVQLFKDRGFLPDMAELLMEMYRDLGIDQANQRVKTLLRTMYGDRLITEAETRQGMSAAGIREAEIDKWIAVGDLERSIPKRMSPAQMEKAFREGMIDDATLTGFFESQGFAPGDVALLVRLAVQAKLEFEGKTDKEKTIAQGKAEKAFQLGIFSESQLLAFYDEAGYDPEDKATLLKIQKELKKQRSGEGSLFPSLS